MSYIRTQTTPYGIEVCGPSVWFLDRLTHRYSPRVLTPCSEVRCPAPTRCHLPSSQHEPTSSVAESLYRHLGGVSRFSVVPIFSVSPSPILRPFCRRSPLQRTFLSLTSRQGHSPTHRSQGTLMVTPTVTISAVFVKTTLLPPVSRVTQSLLTLHSLISCKVGSTG